jgi:hypothetical protein
MPYTPGIEGALPSIQEDNVLTISLVAQATALPAGTAVNARGSIATSPADADFLGVTLQPVEVSTTAKDVAVLYNDIVAGVAGAVIAKGQALTVGANGTLVPVAAGQFIVGLALTAATAIGNPVRFLIRTSKQ